MQVKWSEANKAWNALSWCTQCRVTAMLDPPDRRLCIIEAPGCVEVNLKEESSSGTGGG